MPALAFGLKPGKSKSSALNPGQKRKAVFGEDQDENEQSDAFTNLQKPAVKSSRPKPKLNSEEPPRKSPKLGQVPGVGESYTNLSALRTAKLQDVAASQIDSTVYDYDGVYDTFHAAAEKSKKSDETASGPKYMTSLMQSAEVRKRDQLRAKEKLLQKERENEGDEFKDKEAFVTSAYKKQQEEMRIIEEEEKKREEAEEEKRRKGGGMLEFNRRLLQKEEERSREMEKAVEQAKERRAKGEEAIEDIPKFAEEDTNETKMAAELNEHGARIVMNDEGEVIDKRQLLGAGLNVAPKKKIDVNLAARKADEKPKEWQRSSKAQDARLSQRERQSRMMERQIEEMEQKQREADEAEQKALEEKNKTKITDDVKLGARERFLQRKKEREEEAKRAKSGG